MAACGLFQTPPARLVEVPVDRPVSLLRDPPPDVPPYDVVLGGEGVCPAEYAVCLHKADAAVIAAALPALWHYGQKAWQLCGPAAPKPKEPDPAHPP